MRKIIIIRTIFKIGIKNVFLFILYKILKTSKYYYFYTPKKKCIIKSFSNPAIKKLNFKNNWFPNSKKNYISFMNNLENNFFFWFNSSKYQIDNPPKWFLDPFNGINYKSINKHWSLIDEKEIKDLKNIWELSRWNWSTIIARAWHITGNESYINNLNNWMKDWCKNNPVNYGLNWICGQEASIRLINTLITWKIVNENQINKKTSYIQEFIISHLERISKTILYAESQDNNHWVSEASALFIGGIWLERFTNKKHKGKFYERKGRIHLERSIRRLIMEDGTFSQYSVNYHRFLIDTITQVEWWRKWLKKDKFSRNFYHKSRSACLWLTKFVNTKTGQCPNIGGNDGCFCYQLHNLEYSNFKPSIQLSFLVFFNKFIYPDGPWDEPLYWLGIKKNNYSQMKLIENKFELLKDGGFFVVKKDPSFLAILRLPIYKFRPSQADPMHLDLSIDGLNLLKDGGTFSYSNKSEHLGYFSGIESHNSIQFDEQQPMFKISRFLWGNWLHGTFKKAEIIKNTSQIYIATEYKFKNGYHKREIKFNEELTKIHVYDYISDFKRKAKIRWRLLPTKWELNDLILRSKYLELSFLSDRKIKSIKLLKGFESINYNKLSEVPVLEIVIDKSPCKFETIIKKNIFKT